MKNAIKLMLVLCLFVNINRLSSQCTPNQNFINAGNSGVSPNMMPNGTENAPYQMNYTILVDDSIYVDISNYVPAVMGLPVPSFPALAAINEVTIDAITGLPNGLSIANCNPTACSWPGGGAGCFTIQGTPTETGFFDITITVKKYIDIAAGLSIPSLPGIPLPGVNNAVGPSEDIAVWTLFIDTAQAIDTSGQNNTHINEINGSFEMSVFPNPSKGSTQLNMTNPKNERIEVFLVNHLGSIIKTFSINRTKKVALDTNGIPSGIYFLKARNEHFEINKKLLIQ